MALFPWDDGRYATRICADPEPGFAHAPAPRPVSSVSREISSCSDNDSARADRLEAQSEDIRVVDKDVDDPSRAVFSDVLVQALRKQRRLAAIFAFNKTARRAAS